MENEQEKENGKNMHQNSKTRILNTHLHRKHRRHVTQDKDKEHRTRFPGLSITFSQPPMLLLGSSGSVFAPQPTIQLNLTPTIYVHNCFEQLFIPGGHSLHCILHEETQRRSGYNAFLFHDGALDVSLPGDHVCHVLLIATKTPADITPLFAT